MVLKYIFSVAVCLAIAASAFAEEQQPADSAPKTLTVSARPFKLKVELTGTFEARNMTPVRVPAKTFDAVKLEWVAEPGEQVKKGDVILKLDMSEMTANLPALKAAEQVAEHSLVQAREDLRQSEIATEFQLAQTERAIQVAREDFDYWMKQDWVFKYRQFELDESANELHLETMKMELSELKRMYEADDLIETTEGLVLRRVEQSTNRGVLGWERQKLRLSWEKKVTIPRELEQQQKKLRVAEMQYETAMKNLPLALQRKQLELVKLTADREQAREKLNDLSNDVQIIEITAPADGIVYYGECRNGTWNTVDVAKQLVSGGKVPTKTVLMTVVDPTALSVRASVDEKDLGKFKLPEVDKVRIQPTGYPLISFTGQVEKLASVPAGPVRFYTLINVKGQPDYVVPGMTCRAVYVAYENQKAIIVPHTAVFGDEEDGFYVFVQGEERAEKRIVNLGVKNNGEVEIIEGLNEGETILLEEPK